MIPIVSEAELSELDKKVLNVVQDELPLVSHPFAALAEKVSMSEETFLAHLTSLKERGYLRRFGAFFNSKALGYNGSLIAIRAAEDKIADVAQAINRYPGATHNYEREGEYNLWFTLQTSSDEARRKILSEIKKLPGVERLMDLESEKSYKVRVQFHIR